MFDYYSTVVGLGLMLMLVLLTILLCDEVLKAKEKRYFIIAFSVCIIELILDWYLTYLQESNSDRLFLLKLGTAVMYFIGPSINFNMAKIVIDDKNEKLIKILEIVFVLSMILPFSIFYTDAIFYFDESFKFTRGDYFYILALQILMSCLLLFYSWYKTFNKYQTKCNYIFSLIFLLFLFGFAIDFAFIGLKLMWINEVMVFGFLYILYSTFMSQMDILTGLLNRRSYENQVYDIKEEAIILILDANKFKAINDNFGHTYGDFCLREIGKSLLTVYSELGSCYRIGGDEFCVILTKNLEQVDELNEKLNKILSECPSEHGIPTLSAGYCKYIPGESSVQKTIEDADEMMYIVKSKSRV